MKRALVTLTAIVTLALSSCTFEKVSFDNLPSTTVQTPIDNYSPKNLLEYYFSGFPAGMGVANDTVMASADLEEDGFDEIILTATYDKLGRPSTYRIDMLDSPIIYSKGNLAIMIFDPNSFGCPIESMNFSVVYGASGKVDYLDLFHDMTADGLSDLKIVLEKNTLGKFEGSYEILNPVLNGIKRLDVSPAEDKDKLYSL